eukprot:545593_1
MAGVHLQIKGKDTNKQEEEEKQLSSVLGSVNDNKYDIKQPLLKESINREDIMPNINDELKSNKQLRDINEIYSYLNYCLPPYMNKFSILKCIFLFFGGLVVNLIYIIYNFYSFLQDNRSNYAQNYLWYSRLV